MVNNTFLNNVTQECASYCMRGIVRYLAGDIQKFKEFSTKALIIHEELIENRNWVNCSYKINNKLVKAKINMKTGEIVDQNGKCLRAGVV